MNKDNAAQYLPLVQALADGKVIQSVDSDGEWSDMSDPQFCSKPDRYRIKPEPREWWCVIDKRHPLMTADAARALEACNCNFEAVHVREVTQ